MARVLFGKGVEGEIVAKVQKRLASLGFDPGPPDGSYGSKTEAALSAFQASVQLEQTGELDEETWARLMEKLVPSVAERALQLTASFEGHGFSLAQGNWDGAGLTWGIIGFTLKHGEVSKIILETEQKHPGLVAQAFRERTSELLGIMRSSRREQLEWADSISTTGKVNLSKPWKDAFQRLGELDEVQALQLERADREYFQPASQTARQLDMKSELGLALAFDCQVQNGGVKAAARQKIAAAHQQHAIADEQQLRAIVANAVADASLLRFREDVRSRKMAIATGSGSVHGKLYLLRNWGLDETTA